MTIGCAANPRFTDSPATLGKPIGELKVGQKWRGLASYYAEPYHGRKTASGEVFDMNEMTAAHNWLPFGSTIEVTHLKVSKSCVVRINDRGPLKPGRILDLSRRAAQEIELIGPGVAEVEIRLLTIGGAK